MTDFPITYYEHYTNQAALLRIKSFCESCLDSCGECKVIALKKEIESRTYQNIIPVLELSLEEITDPSEPTYPTEYFLVCLREDTGMWKWKNLYAFISILRMVWWHAGSGVVYDSEERELTLYTMGWSGNEAIIQSLRYTAFWAMYRSNSMQGVYTFKFPKEDIK
ncbi:MAG: hypothetical protein WC936_04705 [Candidatus Nanoarchaeia archaeon]|jgi:hypothetical protein